MQTDRTIVLDLRAEDGHGAVGHARFTYAPGDPDYDRILAHLRGLNPGEANSRIFGV